MKYTDLVIDIETGGLDANTLPILQIGMIPFNRHEAELPPGLLARGIRIGFDAEVQTRDYGRIFDPGTLAWWKQQDAAVRSEVFSGTENITKLFDVLEREIVPQMDFNFQVWAFSPTFDCAAIRSMAKAVGRAVPWIYRNERDVRTITSLLLKDAIQDPIKRICADMNLPGHDALNDCVWEAMHVQTFCHVLQNANLSSVLAVKDAQI